MCREILNLSKCIAYINGDPEFIDGILVRMSQGKNIKCIKNRIVLFNSSVEHYGVTCTNEPTKLAINFNYV